MSKARKIITMAAVLLLIVLAVSLSPAYVARATSCLTDVWVAPPSLGNDANPGTQAQPFAHIQKGIDNVCTGGTVHVAAGTYFENLHIYDTLNLAGTGAPTTIIDGSGYDTVIRIMSDVGQVNIITGFTIQNGHIGGKGGMPVGGGVYVARGHTVTLNECTIKNNIADFLGGGVYNAGKLTLNGCTVNGNSAGMIGGGIANFVDEKPLNDDGLYGSMSLINCTIYGNSVGLIPDGFFASTEYVLTMPKILLGGGVYNGGEASFLNVTIANNTVSANPEPLPTNNNFFNIPIAYAEPVIPEPHGGGFANVPLQCANDIVGGNDIGAPIFTPIATFKNTIVANNLPENGYNDGGLVHSLGHNLDSENTCHFNGIGDLINTDPLLGPLQDNGGPTFTCALPITSPAVDAGDNNGAPTTDQRGVSRPQGIYVDIGAYELEGGGIPESTETHPSYSPPMSNRYLNQANMSVQFVSINPQQATANQPVTISTNVVNTGDQGGNMNVALKINGQVEEARMVSVGPQASQPIKFTVTKSEPGTYSVDIGGQTGSFTIPGAPASSRAPVSAGLIAFIILVVLILATMVLLLSRRPA
jgi:hypothetical protein